MIPANGARARRVSTLSRLSVPMDRYLSLYLGEILAVQADEDFEERVAG